MPSNKKLLQAAAGNAGGDNLYVEDVFSTYLYPGNSSTQTITNDIDLSGEGGLVWIKSRTVARGHNLFDSERTGTAYQVLSTDTTSGQYDVTRLSSLNTNGFSLVNSTAVNGSGEDYASWTFRKAEKFFDVVTYTGDDTSNQTIAHNLGSVPGCIFLKRTSATGVWSVLGSDNSGNYIALRLDSTAASSVSVTKSNVATDSAIDVGYWSSDIKGSMNTSGVTYVAYLFASDAGGFGDDGSENIIKCGSFTNNSASVGVEVNCGFEPQWLLIKGASSGTGLGNWVLIDSMRGASVDSQQRLYPNASTAEGSSNWFKFTSQGFTPNTYFDGDLIYIAIRRPMKTPESGTEVYGVNSYSETNDYQQLTTGNLVDLGWQYLNGDGAKFFTRLLGAGYLNPTSTAAANTSADSAFDFMDGFEPHYANNVSGFNPRLVYGFTRATGFFDVVAYTGNATANRQITHNLNAVPELMLAKTRDAANYWVTYDATNGATNYMVLNTAVASASSIDHWYNTTPTASVVTLGDGNYTNRNATQQILYLFATVAGVSKVGSYTGTAADLNVDCGFSAGARFILIKRTDSSGDWHVWDSSRGISANTDPYLLLNSTAAEVTSTDYIDPLSSGFTVTSTASSTVNVSGGTYIFLAIA